MNSYLFTWKRSECEDPKGEVQNNTQGGREGERNIDSGNREKNKEKAKERGRRRRKKRWKWKKEGSLKRQSCTQIT